MSELKTIKLYGDLGDRFGREFHLAVKNPSEAVRLLSANFKDFAPYLLKNSEPGYHVIVGERDVDVEELNHPVSSREVIKIIPVIEGSGDNPFVRIVVGAALIWATGPAGFSAQGATATAAAGALAGYAGAISAFGASMVLGGVSQLLFSPPISTGVGESPENQPSYSFNGAVNTIRQGNPVPVGYGRLRVGSQVISAGLFSEAIDV